METFHDVIDDLRRPTRELRRSIPDAWAGFAQLHEAALGEDGALPAHVKELIALAIAVADHCDGCVAYHARGAATKGATRDQVVEALGVALLMAGGPASVWAPRALSAFDEFSEPDQSKGAA